MSRWLVTGASGFVGRSVCDALIGRGEEVRQATRRPALSATASQVVVGEVGPTTEWGPALDGVDFVVHLAARVHVLRDASPDPLGAFREVNVHGTRRLAQQAAAAGVRRIVLTSTVKVLGEGTHGRPFSHDDPPAAQGSYALSKWEAELALREVGWASGVEIVIVRPPLVHGPNVGGNLRRLMRHILLGRPIPVGAIDNRRNIVGVANLASLLIHVATAPAAAGQSLLVADQPAVSTAALVSRLAQAMSLTPRIWSVPPWWLRGVGFLAGRSGEVERLIGSLEVDDGHTRSLLEWRPPLTLEAGLQQMAAEYVRTVGQ